ncbi:MAG TPA: response regulator [Gaiellaceae bacterium]|nr:response regulator [Gaiellaceae bacterium]
MTLTFFFSDVEDSSGLAVRLGEGYSPVLDAARELQRRVIAETGGREIDCRGDELFAVFEQPSAAAAAAREAQRAIAAHPWPPGERVRVRIGLHSGEAESAGDGFVGIEVHRASRICQAGHGGQVLLSADVARVVGADARELGTFEFKGLREPERIFQLALDGLESEFPPLRGVRAHDGAVQAVIADDSALLREGLARLLAEADIQVVGQARNADELLLKVRSYHPDVAIVDIRMPPTQTDEGITAALEIREKYPATGVLVLSQHVAHTYAVQLLGESAEGLGYLLKDRVSDVDEFVAAVRRVAEGGSALDPLVVAELVGRARRDDPVQRLSAREREVLELMAEGRSNHAIGQLLFISPRAVEKHVTNIFSKLGPPAAPEDHRRVLAVLTFLRS